MFIALIVVTVLLAAICLSSASLKLRRKERSPAAWNIDGLRPIV